jgi:DNA-binding transcriptional LysR family regulator
VDRWQAMRIFVKVAETESFTESSRVLHISAAAVTRAVASLERTIGTRLFVRTTRSVKLTEGGARYFDDCRRILSDISEAEAAAAGSFAEPSGTLAVTAPALFGHLYVLPILTEYLDLHPAVNARTLFVDRTVNVVEEGIDVAVRIGNLPDSGLTAIKVGSVRRVICGAPSYLAKHGIPTTPNDLKSHRLVVSTSAWTSSEWHFARDERVSVQPTLRSNTNEAAISTALSGWGLTRVLHYQVGRALLEGDLKVVLSDYEEPPLPIYVVFPEGRHAPAKVRAFTDIAVSRLRANRLLN